MKIASLAVLTAFSPDHSRARQHDDTPARSTPHLAARPPVRQPGFADSVAAALDLVPPAGDSADPPAASGSDRTQAVAEFAQALWQAMHENARAAGEHRLGEREHHDHGERAHGWNRNARGYAGLVQQIERLISRYAAESVAPAQPGEDVPAPAPRAGFELPAPPSGAAAEVAWDPPASGAPALGSAVPTAGSPAAGADAGQGGLEGGQAAPVAGAEEEPMDRLPVPDPLMAAFQKMLEAFGITVRPGDGGGAALTDFLARLASGMRHDGRDRGSCGGFVSVTA